MIAGVFFDGRSARLHQVELGLVDGTITVTGGDIARAYQYADTRMDALRPDAPCILDFVDGARCEVDDPEAKGMLATVLGQPAADPDRLREYGCDVLLVLGLFAACTASLLWQA